MRSPVDLLDGPSPPAGQRSTIFQMSFNWYTPTTATKIEFTYDTTDLQWIDVEMVISNVSLTMKGGVRKTYVYPRSN